MKMEFNPENNIVRLCLQGLAMEEKGKPEETIKRFYQAWKEGTTDFEKYLGAYFVGRKQKQPSDTLEWMETALQHALKTKNESVRSAFPSLYRNIGKCYEDLHDPGNAKKNYELASSFRKKPSDKGPFYHGTKADLEVGVLLTAGGTSNYKPELQMNHIYFTASVNGAGLAAALAK